MVRFCCPGLVISPVREQIIPFGSTEVQVVKEIIHNASIVRFDEPSGDCISILFIPVDILTRGFHGQAIISREVPVLRVEVLGDVGFV